MSTPKQAAARLLIHALEQGKPPAQMTREDMAAVLSERVSDQKREKILEFVTKIATPFRDRLTKIAGAAEAGAGEAEAEAGGADAGE